MLLDPRQEILEANRTFYEIFRLGDYARMESLWSRTAPVAVHHPNCDEIDGRENVMASWYQLMVMGEPPPIYPCLETVILNGSKSIVFCTEQVGAAELVGSNIFTYEADQWRIMHHQATQLPRRKRRK